MSRLFFAVMLPAVCGAAIIEHYAGGGPEAPGADRKQIKFVEPFGIVFDKAGTAWVIEYKGNRLLSIAPDGKTSQVLGPKDVHEPHGVVLSPTQQLYIADTHNNRVLRMDIKTRAVTVVAGTGEAGFSGDGGPATKATFKGIFAIDLAPRGDRLYIADLSNRRVRMVDLKSGIVTTVAGNGQKGIPADGATAAESPLEDPRAVAADAKGNVYVLERQGNALRVVDAKGKIRTLIKPGDVQPDMKGPKHLCIDGKDGVIIADAENHLIRRYSVKTGRTETIAGTGTKGLGLNAQNPLATGLNRPHGVWQGPNGWLYITDSYNHRILRMKR